MSLEPGDILQDDPVARRLVAVQQSLLGHGYRYLAGAEHHWPYPFVVMHKDDEYLLLTTADPDLQGRAREVWENLSQANATRGLILVGPMPADHPEVQPVLAEFEGPAAYVQASGGGFHRSGGKPTPKALQRGNLKRIARGDKSEKFAGKALDRLRTDLRQIAENQAFFARADQAGQAARPLLTWGLLAACAVVFVGMFLREGLETLSQPGRRALLDWGALYGPLVRGGQLWRLISSAFLHIGLVHILFNGYALYILGQLFERLQGRGRMATIYGFSILTASLASLWYHPTVISAGASGGVFGLVGGIGGMILRHRRDFPPHLWRAFRRMVLMILLYNAVLMLALFAVIDNAAHVGGLLGGFAMALILTRSPVRRQKLPVWSWITATGLALLVGVAGFWVFGQIPEEAPAETAARERSGQRARIDSIDAAVEDVRDAAMQVLSGQDGEDIDRQQEDLAEKVRQARARIEQRPLAADSPIRPLVNRALVVLDVAERVAGLSGRGPARAAETIALVAEMTTAYRNYAQTLVRLRAEHLPVRP